jgi:CMP-N,N'-diacetyllegionaminic acid synthase
MRFVGLITARGGSKGLPGKNIASAAGRPLIEWTIRAAMSSCLDRCIVSTDSAEIATVCKSAGAEVPFLRPESLAQDDTPHIDVILHAMEWLEAESGLPEYIVLLQPTSPLRNAEDIDGAVQMTIERQADSVISVFPAPSHPYWMRRLDEDGRMSDFMQWPEKSGYLRRQVLPPAYAMNGAIYILRSESLREKRTYFTDRTYGYLMPAARSLDVDNKIDLQIADLLLRQAENKES